MPAEPEYNQGSRRGLVCGRYSQKPCQFLAAGRYFPASSHSFQFWIWFFPCSSPLYLSDKFPVVSLLSEGYHRLFVNLVHNLSQASVHRGEPTDNAGNSGKL